MQHKSEYDIIIPEYFTEKKEKEILKERKTRDINLPIWNFFEKSSDGKRSAYCNYCSKKLSYKTTITNIKTHLKIKHKTEYKHFLKLTERHELAMTARNSKSENENEENMTFENENINCVINSPTPKDSDYVLWSFFEKTNDEVKTAICNYCSRKLTYETELTDLKAHLKIKHFSEYKNYLTLVDQLESAPENSNSGIEYKVTLENKKNDNGSPPTFVIETVESGHISPSLSAHDNLSSDDEKSRNIEQRKRSISLPIWKFFWKLDDYNKIAVCNHCSKKIFYTTTITNLKQHLKIKHPSDYKMLLNLIYQLKSSPENMRTSSSTDSNKERRRRNTSVIWNFFQKSRFGNRIAVCNYCSKKLSYRSTITNIKSHLKMKHKKVYKHFLKLTEQHKSATVPRNSKSENEEEEMTFENEEMTFEHENASNMCNGPTPKDSDYVLWTFFEKPDDETKTAICKFCSKKLSYETKLTDLKAHLKIEHIAEYNNFLALVEHIESAPENSKSDNENKVTFENEELDNGSPPTFVIETVESGHISPSPSAHDNLSSEDEKSKSIKHSKKPFSLPVWNFFRKLNEFKKIAVCNHCSRKLSYKTTITNLKAHLKAKHPSDYKMLLNLTKQLELTPENMRTSFSTHSNKERRRRRHTSAIWNFFDKSRFGNRIAVCNCCNKSLSYRATITNLKIHLKNLHPSEYSIFYKLTKQIKSANTSEDSASEAENTENNKGHSEFVAKKKRGSHNNGIIWNFFEESHSGDKNAVCNYCSKTLSYKSTITNLKLHLKARHRPEYKIFVELTKQLRDVRKKLENSTSDIEETENVRPSTSEDGGSDRHIWKYYERSDYGHWIAICNYCSSHLSYQSTIINLITHLKVKHNEIYREYLTVGEGLKAKKRRHSSLSFDYGTERSDGVSESDEDLPLKRRARREPSIDTSNIESSNNIEQHALLIPADGIKRRTSSDIADEDATERDQDAEKDEVWNFFEKMPSNRAQCILCKETFNRHVPFLTKHLHEKHRKVALDLPSDSDEDQNCYTEVVYLEEEQPVNVKKQKKMKPLPEPRKRTSSSRYEYVNKTKDDETSSKNEGDEEIENFGRYVIGLLKKMPKDVSTQLQMDIISMIMTAKLKIGTPSTDANLSVSNVQIVTSDDIVTTPGNVIVTTPSSVIHTTQNNESLPTLVIGVQNES